MEIVQEDTRADKTKRFNINNAQIYFIKICNLSSLFSRHSLLMFQVSMLTQFDKIRE